MVIAVSSSSRSSSGGESCEWSGEWSSRVDGVSEWSGVGAVSGVSGVERT